MPAPAVLSARSWTVAPSKAHAVASSMARRRMPGLAPALEVRPSEDTAESVADIAGGDEVAGAREAAARKAAAGSLGAGDHEADGRWQGVVAGGRTAGGVGEADGPADDGRGGRLRSWGGASADEVLSAVAEVPAQGMLAVDSAEGGGGAEGGGTGASAAIAALFAAERVETAVGITWGKVCADAAHCAGPSGGLSGSVEDAMRCGCIACCGGDCWWVTGDGITSQGDNGATGVGATTVPEGT